MQSTPRTTPSPACHLLVPLCQALPRWEITIRSYDDDDPSDNMAPGLRYHAKSALHDKLGPTSGYHLSPDAALLALAVNLSQSRLTRDEFRALDAVLAQYAPGKEGTT